MSLDCDGHFPLYFRPSVDKSDSQKLRFGLIDYLDEVMWLAVVGVIPSCITICLHMNVFIHGSFRV